MRGQETLSSLLALHQHSSSQNGGKICIILGCVLILSGIFVTFESRLNWKPTPKPLPSFSPPLESSASAQMPLRLSISTASYEELVALPQIGAVTAQKLINHRPYRSVIELVDKKILSPRQYAANKDRLQL